MTCNNCLQEILQGESFFEDEDNGTAYHADCRQAAVDRRNRAEDERAAALARAEAAEAEVSRLRDENAEAWHAFDRQQDRADRLAARVAELEAALAARPPGYLNALDARDATQSGLQRIAALVDVPGNAPAEEIVSAVERAVTARGWRPIGEPAPKGEIEVKMRCAVGDDGQIYKTRTDIFVGWWTVADDSEWRPLPPAPQEPTP